MRKMRAKMKVSAVGGVGTSCENIRFSAVRKPDAYPEDGTDENNTFAKWTPSAELTMSITNPALHNTFEVGQTFYVDFSPAE